MKIICNNCQNVEKVNTGLIVKIIGGVLPLGGFWAWTTYLFAGTGLALPIVIAIIGGGVITLAFQKEIVKWITKKNYNCSKCSSSQWEIYDKKI